MEQLHKSHHTVWAQLQFMPQKIEGFSSDLDQRPLKNTSFKNTQVKEYSGLIHLRLIFVRVSGRDLLGAALPLKVMWEYHKIHSDSFDSLTYETLHTFFWKSWWELWVYMIPRFIWFLDIRNPPYLLQSSACVQLLGWYGRREDWLGRTGRFSCDMHFLQRVIDGKRWCNVRELVGRHGIVLEVLTIRLGLDDVWSKSWHLIVCDPASLWIKRTWTQNKIKSWPEALSTGALISWEFTVVSAMPESSSSLKNWRNVHLSASEVPRAPSSDTSRTMSVKSLVHATAHVRLSWPGKMKDRKVSFESEGFAVFGFAAHNITCKLVDMESEPMFSRG